ncbi:MAG: 30S ribosomal protein S16 [Candidatus Riflebacteria bacterium HGW-Riflebacteria-2]|jgi:small subunit ribosomal protein S16|nr:MAG: 30S ribosomal protein S16 [Candidatus Riflebacteria bacterium HGW-Riflebacteria-2]
MAVSIRLKVLGTKHRPCYRIVALDSRKTRDGKTLENLGHYAPQTEQPIVDLKEETVLEYLNDGAVPTETVKNILRQRGIVKIQQKAENGTVKLVWTKRA